MRTLLLIGVLASAISSAHASEFRVRLSVRSCNPHWSGNQLAVLVFDEIRHLEGVTVVNDDPQYRIECTAIPLGRTAAPGGYAVSIVFLSSDGRLLADVVREGDSLDYLAHDIAHVTKYMLPELTEDTK